MVEGRCQEHNFLSWPSLACILGNQTQGPPQKPLHARACSIRINVPTAQTLSSMAVLGHKHSSRRPLPAKHSKGRAAEKVEKRLLPGLKMRKRVLPAPALEKHALVKKQNPENQTTEITGDTSTGGKHLCKNTCNSICKHCS